MKTVKFDRYIFFDKKQIGTINRMLRHYGVRKNSYAGGVIVRLYNYYFGNSIDVKKEFKKYYYKEYDKNYNEYLQCHFDMPERLSSVISKSKVFYVDLDGKFDRVGDSFYDDDLVEDFWNYLGGIDNENTYGIRYK